MDKRPDSTEIDYAAFVAIDWADKKHVWALQVAGQTAREHGELKHGPEEIDVWATGLAVRFQNRPIAVCLEQAHGPLLFALLKYGHLVIYPIHGSTSAKYREAMAPSGSKDDPADADLLLDLLVLHRNRLRKLEPDNQQIRTLQGLVQARRQMVDDRTGLSNRLTAYLKLYFPQVLGWFDEVTSAVAGAFLERWPRLEEAQKATPEALRQFFHEHHSRSEERIDERLEAIRTAQPLTRDEAVIRPTAAQVKILLRQVAVLRSGISELEEWIEEEAAANEDYEIFQSFPSAGEAMRPRLMAAFGSRRERYNSAFEIQCYSGIAPITVRTGQTQWVHFRWACPKFLRQTFHEYAAISRRSCVWARELYDELRARGKEHHAAVRVLAFKWMRIMYRCWKDRTPYDEARYLHDRDAHRSKEAAQTKTKSTRPQKPASHQGNQCARPRPVEMQFKSELGFCKFSGLSS